MIKMNEEDMDCPDNPILNPWVILIILIIIVLILLVVIIWSNRKAIKFWIFVRFGIKFKDEDEVEDLEKMKYDAFVNYRYSLVYM